METSLRFGDCGGGVGGVGGGRNSKSLRIHAKEKFPIDSNTHLQVHGALDTGLGVPSYCSAVMRHFYPYLSASLGVGLQYSKHDKLRYCVRGKKSFSVTNNGLLNFNIKGRCDADKEFTEKKSSGAAEFTWSILDFRPDQHVRFKLGYEVFEKVAYVQVMENNWSLNANANGKWNVRFDL